MRSRSALTLVELLVVVAIVAVLAAVLLPVFAPARERGRRAACIANLRQIGAAIAMYAQDHDAAYPCTGDPYLWVGKRWRWTVMPYLAIGQREGTAYSSRAGSPSILLCPSDTLSGSAFDATSYAYSAAFYHTPSVLDAMRIANLRLALAQPGPGAVCTAQLDAAVAEPARKALVAEWTTNHDHPAAPVGYWGTLSGTATPGPDRWTGARAMVFADGHAGSVRADAVRASAEDCPDILLTPGGLTGADLR